MNLGGGEPILFLVFQHKICKAVGPKWEKKVNSIPIVI